MNLWLLLVLLPSLMATAESHRILALVPYGSKSHQQIMSSLVEALASRGHDMTIVSSYEQFKSTNPKVTEIVISRNAEIANSMVKNTFNTLAASNPVSGFISMLPALTGSCENFLAHSYTKNLLRVGKDQFDLVLLLPYINECAMVVATQITRNAVCISLMGTLPPSISSAPSLPSVVPSPLAGLPSKMNFLQRVKNLFASSVLPLVFDTYVNYHLQNILDDRVPGLPTIHESHKIVSFILHTGDPVMVPPSPGFSNIVGIGTFHCKDSKPLPQDLLKFVESSGEDGFIYFSLGSIAPSSQLPLKLRNHFLNAFSRLKQKVLWKFEEKLDNLPPNVKIVKWAPQQDILGHPKIRGFITHGGLLSLQETVYHGVPVVVIPLFGDQPGNAARAEELRLGVKLQFLELTEDKIYDAIHKIVEDKSYTENAKRYSSIIKDQPQKPLERAMFWIEYVIRHKGADHLRSPGEDLNIFQYYLLDVFGFLAFVLIAISVSVYFIVKGIVIKFRRPSSKAKKYRKKKSKSN